MRSSARTGLHAFTAREKHCKAATYGRAPRLFASQFESNWDYLSDILDCHVAAILVPFRSRGPAD